LVVVDSVRKECQARNGLLKMSTKVRIELREFVIVQFDLVGCVVELVEIVKWSNLERLRDFSVLNREFDLSFNEIDLRSSSADGDVGSGVVFAGTSACGKSLTGEVGKHIALGTGSESCFWGGSVWPGLVRKCPDITRVVGVPVGQ
jgi:hypothetical protein